MSGSRSGGDSSGWGWLPTTAQVWPGQAGRGVASSRGRVGRHPPAHPASSVPHPRLGALQPGIWSGLLEGLVQFPWVWPSTARDAMCPPQSSGAPLGSLAGNPSCATTEPSDGASEGVAPGALPVPCVPWHRSSGARGGACSTPELPPLFQIALEPRSLSCPAPGSDPLVGQLSSEDTAVPPGLRSSAWCKIKAAPLAPPRLLAVTPLATAPSPSTPRP